jgi:transposase
MAQNFLSCDREQELLLPPSLSEWVGEDHVVWFVLDAVETMDLAVFYTAYRADGHGRAAHDPAMMVALLLYSYACGERSSRAIERRCREDVPTRVICANRTPDHCTISRFRARHDAALGGLFTQILGLCARAGLVSVGVIALDGTAIAANASVEATRSHESIREEVERILGEAAEIDAREDEQFGEARGDELPADLRDRRSRLERLRRCREELEAEQAKVEAAYQANLQWRAEWEADHGRKLGGRKPFAPDPDGLAKRTINITDRDSRVIRREGRPPVQGYNAQAVATRQQIVIAADVTQQSNDSGQLEPMIRQAVAEIHAAGVEERVGTVLADGGYWNNPHIVALGAEGMQVIVPTRAAHRMTARKLSPKQGPEAERIDRLLETPEGKALYRDRQHMIETVFADTKFNRGIRRFHRRGFSRLPGRVAADHRHAQPLQASPSHPNPLARVARPARPATASDTSTAWLLINDKGRLPATFAQQPQMRGFLLP